MQRQAGRATCRLCAYQYALVEHTNEFGSFKKRVLDALPGDGILIYRVKSSQTSSGYWYSKIDRGPSFASATTDADSAVQLIIPFKERRPYFATPPSKDYAEPLHSVDRPRLNLRDVCVSQKRLS